MKRKVLTTATLLLLAAATMFAASDKEKKEKNGKNEKPETVSVSGTVFDKASGEALAGVLIKVSETDIAVYSDFDGNFTLENIKSGEHKIETTLISYKATTQKIEAGTPGEGIKVTLENVK